MHRHRPKTSKMFGWSGCVSGGGNCGTAHGGVTYRETCSCGAERLVESNGRHEANSGWYMPECPNCKLRHPVDQSCR